VEPNAFLIFYMGIEFLRNYLNATIAMSLKFHEDDGHSSRIENITYNDF